MPPKDLASFIYFNGPVSHTIYLEHSSLENRLSYFGFTQHLIQYDPSPDVFEQLAMHYHKP